MILLLFIFTVLLSGMLGVSLGYHRYLAHKSFKPVRWFEVLIVFLGLPAGTPIQWAGNHRYHHMHADTEKDPHSPHFGGFWWAHNGWYLNSKNKFLCFIYALAGPARTLWDAYYRPKTNQEYNYLAKDISKDPVFSWMSKPRNYFFLIMLHTLVPILLLIYFKLWWDLLIFYLLYLYIYNLGDGVNSFGHIIGKRNQNCRHKATNWPILGYLAFGDGWHANHHDDPVKAQHGRGIWQFDPSYYLLRLLHFLGIVKSLKV